MESETASSVDENVVGAAADTRGKHRVLAELNRVEQEIKSLEEELEELENTSTVSSVCEELLSNVEKIPDPLLSFSIGPPNPLWDRWFEGPQQYQGCRCQIL